MSECVQGGRSMNRFSGRSRVRGIFVSPGAFAALLFALLVAGCVMAEPALAAHLTVYVKPYSVDLTTQGALAVGEEVPVEVRGIKDGMAVSNWIGAVTRGTNIVGVCTNLVMGTNGIATGSVDCATVEMGSLFAGASPLAERDLVFTILETTDGGLGGRLVASGTAIVRNNPLSPEAIAQFAPTGEQLWNSAFCDAMREWADARFASSNALDLAVSALDGRIDGLYGECAGGWRWPIWLDLDDMWPDAAFATNASTATVTAGCMRVERTATTVLGNDWIFVPGVRDNRAGLSPSLAWEPVAAPGGGGIDPSLLEASTFLDDPGDEWERCRVSFAEGVTPSDLPEDPAEWKAAVRGSLAADGETVFSCDFRLDPEVDVKDEFLGPASNTVFAAAWDTVMTAAAVGTNDDSTVRAMVWPTGEGDRTNHPVDVAWNTNWWARDLVDLSCHAYHTDMPIPEGVDPGGFPGGIEAPCILLTPRHVLAADHYKPQANRTVYWLSRSGQVLTNSVTEWINPRGDIAVGRLARPFSTNDCLPATLLATNYPDFVAGSPNGMSSSATCWGIPVVCLDLSERAYVTGWKPAVLRSGSGRDRGKFTVSSRYFNESTNLPAGVPRILVGVPSFYIGGAFGGCSGHPTFLCTGGGRPPCLLGLWHTATGGPMPDKAEIDAVIRGTWGDTERCTEFKPSTHDFRTTQ